MQGYLISQCAAARVGAHPENPDTATPPQSASPADRRDVHHYQQVKPDLLARLISCEGNQDRRVSSDAGIPAMRITLKTHNFTTSYTITP
jgi:hypothetical protein